MTYEKISERHDNLKEKGKIHVYVMRSHVSHKCYRTFTVPGDKPSYRRCNCNNDFLNLAPIYIYPRWKCII